MKISEVQEILNGIQDKEGNVKILGISVIENNITVCYEDADFNVRCIKSNYKNCDVY